MVVLITEGFELYFNYFLSEEGEEAVRLHVQEERGGGRGRSAALRTGGEGPALLAQNPGDNPYLGIFSFLCILLSFGQTTYWGILSIFAALLSQNPVEHYVVFFTHLNILGSPSPSSPGKIEI